jgi:hypothetical protein
MPSGTHAQQLREEINSLSLQHNGPPFEPHVTLLPDIKRPREEVIAICAQLASTLKVRRCLGEGSTGSIPGCDLAAWGTHQPQLVWAPAAAAPSRRPPQATTPGATSRNQPPPPAEVPAQLPGRGRRQHLPPVHLPAVRQEPRGRGGSAAGSRGVRHEQRQALHAAPLAALRRHRRADAAAGGGWVGALHPCCAPAGELRASLRAGAGLAPLPARCQPATEATPWTCSARAVQHALSAGLAGAELAQRQLPPAPRCAGRAAGAPTRAAGAVQRRHAPILPLAQLMPRPGATRQPSPAQPRAQWPSPEPSPSTAPARPRAAMCNTARQGAASRGSAPPPTAPPTLA